jgi:probable HAF family extracellular repeat protein
MRARSLGAGLAVVLLLVNAPYAGRVLADPPAYLVENLGSLGGDSVGRAINASGATAGYGTVADGTFRPFAAAPSATLVELPTPAGGAGQAFGLNDAGTVSGSAVSADGFTHAFRILSGQPPQDLGTLGGATSSGYAVNASHAVAGYSATAAGPSHAFRYSDGSGLEDLGTLGGVASFGYGINASGVVVGQSYLADRSAHGFIYADGVMSDIGTIGGNLSTATAVNAGGLVVGASTVATGRWHAVIKRPGLPLEDLGTLGGVQSSAEGVNAAGDVVGWSNTTAGPMHAFLWTAANGLVDLNSLVDPAEGWTFVAAYGINDKGQVTGYGLLGGEVRAFRLSPAVTVDGTPPVITALAASPSVLDSPNHRMVPVTVTATATDDSGAVPGCVVTDVTSNEPDNGLGDGDTAGDIIREGGLALQLRAERSAHGNGRVYAITVMCTDEAGNAASGVTNVLVPKGSDEGGSATKVPGKKR